MLLTALVPKSLMIFNGMACVRLKCIVLVSRSISVKYDPRPLFQSPYSSRFTETLLL